ncbi:hypothetical protein COR52_26285 [Vibrio mediterranei]|uniref:Uncharacterized protein n=1 Tax=Vibrio mediterranei TaxID=689 RepID=A0ABX5D6S7_9VIBR|nr:hypothetical protein COR52_26285 [Vibrio mediterranei]PRQ65394.1 hypothetical protein COR51_22485 [Vibrio mediterranei]
MTLNTRRYKASTPPATMRKHDSLIIKKFNGQDVARFLAPKGGWTQWDIWQATQQLHPKWTNEPICLYLGKSALTTESIDT